MDRRAIILNPMQASMEIAKQMLGRGLLLKTISPNEMTFTIVRTNNKSDEELDLAVREFKVLYTVIATFAGLAVPKHIRYKIVTAEERVKENKEFMDNIPPWFPKMW